MYTQPELEPIGREENDAATFRYGTATIHVVQDEFSGNPRDWDNAWAWYSNHRNYMFDTDCKIEDIYDEDDRKKPESTIDAILRQNPDVIAAVPIFMLEHSGVTLSLHSFDDPWDSGVCAIAVLTGSAVKQYYPDCNDSVIERAKKDLKEEVHVYNRWLKNDVYGYVIDTVDKKNHDSCWGYYLDEFSIAKEAIAGMTTKDATKVALTPSDILKQVHGGAFEQISFVYNKQSDNIIGCVFTNKDGDRTPKDETASLTASELAVLMGYDDGEFSGSMFFAWYDQPRVDMKG